MKGIKRHSGLAAAVILTLAASSILYLSSLMYSDWNDRATAALSVQLNSGHLEGPPHPEQIADLGAYGDSFGSVTSGFTMLTFVLIAFTTLLQVREFGMQREESRKARETQEIQAALENIRLVADLTSLHIEGLNARAQQNRDHIYHLQLKQGKMNAGKGMAQLESEIEERVERIDGICNKIEEATNELARLHQEHLHMMRKEREAEA